MAINKADKKKQIQKKLKCHRCRFCPVLDGKPCKIVTNEVYHPEDSNDTEIRAVFVANRPILK